MINKKDLKDMSYERVGEEFVRRTYDSFNNILDTLTNEMDKKIMKLEKIRDKIEDIKYGG